MIERLSLFPDFLTTAQHDELIDAIDSAMWSDALRRRTQHYGWRYSYDRRPLDTSDYLGEFPPWLIGLANRVGPAFSGVVPDQAIVNDYQPGQGISAHVDHVRNFGPAIVSVSLCSPATMVFARGGRQEFLELPPRSLLLLEGDARYRYTHAIPRHTARRVSVTFRSVIVGA